MFLKFRNFLLPAILVLSLFVSPFLKGGQIFGQTPSVPEDVQSKTGVVVSASGYASDVGAEILHQGGNAVDAAVATAFALAVTHPSAGNIGGGGFMIVRRANGETITIDYREKAPQGSTQTMYLNKAGEIDRSLTAAGYLAPGEGNYEHGFENGTWRDFHENGVLAAEGEYKDGVKFGVWKYWDSNGNHESSE